VYCVAWRAVTTTLFLLGPEIVPALMRCKRVSKLLAEMKKCSLIFKIIRLLSLQVKEGQESELLLKGMQQFIFTVFFIEYTVKKVGDFPITNQTLPDQELFIYSRFPGQRKFG
jgi:hypothetical protein